MRISKRLCGKLMMAACIAACVIPFLVLMVMGGTDKLYWLGLLACIGMHLLMMKMMPGHQSCHDSKSSEHQAKANVLPKHTMDA